MADKGADKDEALKKKMEDHLGNHEYAFSMNYFTYALLSIIETFCGCCVRCLRLDRDGSCLKGYLYRKKRIDLAVQKMQHEMSVMTYIRASRIAHLASKTFFNRRQRMSTQYFRRYAIRSEDLAKDENPKNMREFDEDRVISECDYNNNKLDRRILYELTGEKLEEDDYLDETSESEREDIPALVLG